LFRLRQWIYRRGALHRPPSFWVRCAEFPHPSQFKEGT
jgi:hypothetical protein